MLLLLIASPAYAGVLRAGDMAVELAHEKGVPLSRPLRESFRMSRAYVRKTMGY